MTVFNLEVPALLDTLTVVLMPIAYGAAFITATVVRYVIIPEEIAQQRPFGTFFKNYELVMHNYTAIFLAVDLWLVQAHLNWEFGIFPVCFGIVYVLFSYAYARLPQGITSTRFLTRGSTWLQCTWWRFCSLAASSTSACGRGPSSVECTAGWASVGVWVSRIVLFRRHVSDNPYAFQSSTEG